MADAGARPGCDVERIERRDPGFVRDYFTPEEVLVVAACPEDERDLVTTLLWSAKESALKALRQGLRRDTRSVRADYRRGSVDDAWSDLRVTCKETGRVFRGGWRRTGSEVFTFLS